MWSLKEIVDVIDLLLIDPSTAERKLTEILKRLDREKAHALGTQFGFMVAKRHNIFLTEAYDVYDRMVASYHNASAAAKAVTAMAA